MNRKFSPSKTLKRAALALSLGALSMVGAANAGNPYSSPSRWNNFRPALGDALADEAAQAASDATSELRSNTQQLPAPSAPKSARQNDLLLDGPSHSGSNYQNNARQNNNAAPSPSSSAPLAPSGYPMGGYPSQGYSQHGQSPAAPTPAPPITSSNGQIQSYPSAPMAQGYGHDSMALPADASYPANQSYAGQNYAAGGGHSAAPIVGSGPANGSYGGSCGGNGGGSYAVGGGYQQAMSAPWGGSGMGHPMHQGGYGAGSCGVNARNELSPWFGNFGLAFWKMEQNSRRLIATGVGSNFTTSLVDPDASLGFDVGFGRYFGCGKYGAGVNYMLWNPSSEQVTRTGTAGAIRATMPQYRDVNMNFGTADSVYNLIDGTAVDSAGATAVRATRDLSFQGIEANIYSFGLMGAQRASYAGCGNGRGIGSSLGLGNLGAGRGARYGYGGAAGPLVRASSGRVRVMTSHGFRWFQIKDSSELAYNIDGAPGYQIDDIYDNVDTENNLFGYQFGGRLTYCVGSRLDLNLGGKFGVYSNRAEVKHRLGSQGQLAYLTASGTDDVNTEYTDTVLATLGELDLGFGLRITNGWTARAGYRVMGITGVANAVESYPQNYSSVAASGEVRADDSYFLHGAYFGAEFNW